MKYTVKQIMKWKPCYALWRVQKFVGDGLDANGLAHLDIPRKDRVCVLIHMLYDTCGKDAVVSFAGNCALRAYYNYYAVADAATYATYAAANAAADAAQMAAGAAVDANYAGNAAYAGAADAACVSANAAANSARAAAYANHASDYAAAATAAENAERQWQIDYLVKAIVGTK